PTGSTPPNVMPSGYAYDVEDRPANGTAEMWGPIPGGGSYTTAGGLTYDHTGKKVFWKGSYQNGDMDADEYRCEIYFYGITGQKLARYKCWYGHPETGGHFGLSVQDRTQHIGGELTTANGSGATTDRLGSLRKKDNGESY